MPRAHEPSVSVSVKTVLIISPVLKLCLYYVTPSYSNKTKIVPEGHVTITQSPEFTIEFTHGVVYSMGLDECIMACIPRYGIRVSALP